MATNVPNPIYRQEDWFLYMAGQGNLPEGGAQNRLEEWYMYLAANTQGKIITTSVTLDAADWSNGSQTVSVSDITADSGVLVAPAPASIEDYGKSGVYCASQAAGTLTFSYGAAVPTADLTVNIMIVG